MAAPLIRSVIFAKATSRAKSGEPFLGFTSMLKGEKPQSSVAPKRALGMYFDAVTRASHTSSAV